MMRFKEFLSEVQPADLHKQELSFSEIKDWVLKHSPHYLQTNIPIWRGVLSTQAEGMYDTSKLNRRAANTHNFYNLWLSNHPDWREFPKRNQSFVGSSAKWGAYGPMKYVLVPKDSASIGICPKSDMWTSFYWMNKRDIDMSDFMNAIEYLFRETGFSQAQVVSFSWPELQAALKKLDVETVGKIIDGIKGMSIYDIDRNSISEIDRSIETNMYDLFGKIFKTDNFELQYARDYRGYPDTTREVWTSGEILLLDEKTWLKIIEEHK